MNKNFPDLEKFILDTGYEEIPRNADNDRQWAKKIESVPKCQMNQKTPSLILIHHQITLNGETHSSYSLNLTALPAYGEWVKLKVYATADENLKSTLFLEERKLVAAWSTINRIVPLGNET